MADLESLALLLQVMHNLEKLRANMRANAAAYKANLVAGKPTAQVATVMEQDALAFIALTDLGVGVPPPGHPRDVLLTGFAMVHIAEAAAIDIATELRPIAQQQLALARSTPTEAQIHNGMDQLLATVPAHESLWPQLGTAVEPTG